MKKVLLLSGLVLFAFTVFAQEEKSEKKEEKQAPGPAITFEEVSHDFGDIHQGDVVEWTFKFANTGDEPLILSNVATTCGCTVPQWPRDPIAKGEKSEITVKFNSAGKMGMQNKVITIYSNAITPTSRVSIVTNVLPKKADGN